MSLQPQDFNQDNGQLAEKIATYLSQHSDFFIQHADVLATLAIPHDTGGAVSLVERQVRVLREENQKYRTQLEGLVQIARENDNIASRLHHLTLALIETQGTDGILNTLQDAMRELLNADAVAMKLFDSQALAEHRQEFSPAMFQDFLDNDRPSCGELAKQQVDYLFGEQGGGIRSVALIPVRSANLVGVVAIGSRDAQRFNLNKSVDFLQRLGEIISAKLGLVGLSQ